MGELVEDGVLTVPYVATTSKHGGLLHEAADFFTKSLAAAQFYAHRSPKFDNESRATCA